MSISKETFNFFHAYRHMVKAELHLTDILNEGNVAYDSKEFVKALKRRLDANTTGLRLLLPRDTFKVLEDQMLDPEVTLQIDNINNMLAELPKAIRDQMESHIEGHYKVYKIK